MDAPQSQRLKEILKSDPGKYRHYHVIKDVLEAINKKTNKYILKGGASLMMCYGLDRFSEGIDLDSTDHETLGPLLKRYASQHGYSINVDIYTQTVQRYMLHYGAMPDKPLEIEASFRSRILNPNSVQTVNGIFVYKPETIFRMKLGAYVGRDHIRDLHDIVFIFKKYRGRLLGTDIEAVYTLDKYPARVYNGLIEQIPPWGIYGGAEHEREMCAF